MKPMEKIRQDLADTIAQAEAMTTRDDFAPEDPGYVALREAADRLERSYQEMASWEQRKATSNEVGAALHSASQRQEATKVRQAEAPAETLGETFVRSDVFTQYPGRGTSSRVEIVHERATSLPSKLGDFSALFSTPVRDITPPAPATPLLDSIPAIPVSSNSVETVVWANTGGTTAAVTAEGILKQDVEYGITVVPITLDTIAAWTQLTRQLIEDGPAVRARIDSMLAREIVQKQEAEAAAALVAATLPTATAETLIEAIRLGMAEIQVEGYSPNGVLLHPADFAALDIDVFSSTLNGPRVNGSFWGLTPIPHAAQAEGTATVGDFSVGMERYVRTGVNLYITDSHGDTFTSNIFTLLAEARGKSVVVRPAAFVECSAVPATP